MAISPVLAGSRTAALMVLLSLTLSWGLSTEAATGSNLMKQVKRHHAEVSTSLVRASSMKAMEPHQSQKALLEEAVVGAEEELEGNEAEQAHIRGQLAQLAEKQVSLMEVDSHAKKEVEEIGSPAFGTVLGKMREEMSMFDVPSKEKHALNQLEVLRADEKEVEAKLAKDEVNLHNAAKNSQPGAETWDQPKKEMKAPNYSLETGTPKAPNSNYNFWGMTPERQQAMLLSTLVYLCFGVLCAYLYLEARVRYADFFVPKTTAEVFPKNLGFSFGLFDCFTDWKVCAVGCCCPFLRWADTMDRQELLSYWKAFFAMFGLLLLHVYTYGLSDVGVVMLGVFYRQKLRSRFQIESGSWNALLNDCLAWLCCQPCAIIQEAREDSVQRGAGV